MSAEDQSGVSPGLLSRLPAELLVQVAENLPMKTRKKLSVTNSYWRSYLVSSLYITIKASNTKEHEEIVSRVVSKYGRYVRRLYMECRLKPNPPTPRIADNADSEYEIVGNELSHTAAKLLRGELLPNVTSLGVEFLAEKDFEGPGWDEFDGSAQPCRIANDAEDGLDEVHAKEAHFRWRGAMTRIWDLVALNQRIESLDIYSLPPKMTSAWMTRSWTDFLGRLNCLSIGLWGCEFQNPSDLFTTEYHSNTRIGYQDFLASLQDPFCRFANHLRQLSIIADVSNPYGSGGPDNFYSLLSLKDSHMPMLEELKLENCIIDWNLTAFIKGHAKVLQRLSFIDCMAGPSYSWAALFTGIAKCSPVLSELVITDEFIPIGTREWCSDYDPPDDEPDKVQQIRRELKQDRRRRLFAYIDIWIHGEPDNDPESNVMHYLDGQDQKAYDKVMQIVRRNAWQQKYPDGSYKMKLEFLLD